MRDTGANFVRRKVINMALLTLSQYKAIKGITDNSSDAKLQAIIDAVENEIRGICGYSDSETLPAALMLTACDMVDHQLLESSGIVSQTLEGNTVTFESGYSQKILRTLNKYRRVGYV